MNLPQNHTLNTWYKRIRCALELSVPEMEIILTHGQAQARNHASLKLPSRSRIRAWALAENDVDFRKMRHEEFDWFTKGLTPFFEDCEKGAIDVAGLKALGDSEE